MWVFFFNICNMQSTVLCDPISEMLNVRGEKGTVESIKYGVGHCGSQRYSKEGQSSRLTELSAKESLLWN